MRRSRSEIQVFSISLLDILSCALGAVIILLVIIPNTPASPEAQMSVVQSLKAAILSLEDENESLRNELPSQSEQLQNQTKTPTLFGLTLHADNAIFIIDVSGSMSWQIDNLYGTLESLLLGGEVERFRFVYFDGYTYSSMPYWPGGWLDGTPGNKRTELERAVTSIRSLIQSEPMGTNSNEVLLEALEFDETDVIYFITDGYPTIGEKNVDRILSNVRQSNRNDVIINSIMVGLPGAVVNQYGRVGFDPNAHPKELYDFLHELAKQNNGVYVGR